MMTSYKGNPLKLTLEIDQRDISLTMLIQLSRFKYIKLDLYQDKSEKVSQLDDLEWPKFD